MSGPKPMTPRKPEAEPTPAQPHASPAKAFGPDQRLALVRTELGMPGLRWLGPGDGRLLVELVRACYGDTYSYAALYRAEEIEALWARGSLLSLGHLDERGHLDGHTAFWIKDPTLDHVESGVSLVHPSARKGFDVDLVLMWPALLERWAKVASFVHQHTTTRHVNAQLHAARHMRARATGWIFDYALGEVLVGIDESPAPMHALTMSTALQPSSPELAAPEGPWAAWLGQFAMEAQPGAMVTAVAWSHEVGSVVLDPIEHNHSLDLRRRVVTGLATDGAAVSEPSVARVELLHLPMRPSLVAETWASLMAAGYVPVGVLPHRRRSSEIVLQRIDVLHAHAAMSRMHLAGARMRRLAVEWQEACAHTS